MATGVGITDPSEFKRIYLKIIALSHLNYYIDSKSLKDGGVMIDSERDGLV